MHYCMRRTLVASNSRVVCCCCQKHQQQAKATMCVCLPLKHSSTETGTPEDRNFARSNSCIILVILRGVSADSSSVPVVCV